MTRSHDIRKGGIPVLAYPHCDAAPMLSSMMFRFNEAQATASILLQLLLHVNGYDEPQTFTLQYDADNLKPGSLGPATIPLPQHRLDEIAREGNPQMQTLSLTLKRTAPMWSPRDVRLRPQPGHEVAFDQVAVLARATTLHILFDFNWLHRDHHAVFRRLVARPDELRGFPVWRHYSKLYRKEDWQIFEDQAVHEDDVIGEFPPVYSESSKRPRHVTPTPSSPPAKRALLSPYPEPHSSPTEKDSIATPSPKLAHSSAAPSPRFPPLDVPEIHHTHTPKLNAASNSGAVATTPEQLHDTVALEGAISSLLPTILSSLLPTLLPRLLTQHSPSPAPSLLDLPSQRATPPPPLLPGPAPQTQALRPPFPASEAHTSAAAEIAASSTATALTTLSNLGLTLSDHVSRRIEAELGSLYAHTVSHANYLRNEADAQFWEEREGERLGWNKEVDEGIEEARGRLVDVGVEEVERVEGVLEEVGDRCVERVGAVVEEALARVEGLRGEQDVRDLRREKKELRRDVKDLRQLKSALRRDVRELRRVKRDLQGGLRNESISTQSAISTVDSQDLDA